MSSADQEDFHINPVSRDSYPYERECTGLLKAKDIPDDVLEAFLGAIGVTEDTHLIDRLTVDMKWCDAGLVHVTVGRYCANNRVQTEAAGSDER